MMDATTPKSATKNVLCRGLGAKSAPSRAKGAKGPVFRDAATVAAAAMTEAELTQNVLDLARALGFLAFHARDSRRSEPGFPDILLVGHGRILVVECKTEKGKLRPAVMGKRRMLPGQQDWLDAFAECGAEAYLWRPSAWLDGEIERVLKGVSK